MNPKISIILATYNRSRLLDRPINSIIKQSFSDWELVIVDDGSCDDTKKHIKEISKKDKRIKHIFSKHKGVAHARNIAIKKCKGDYITFIDSDDAYLKNHLKIHHNYLNKNPSVDMIWGGVKVIGNSKIPDQKDKNKLVEAENCTLCGTFFIKNEVLKIVKGFPNISYAEDHALYELIKKKGFNIKKVNYKTYRYYRNEQDSICNIVKKSIK